MVKYIIRLDDACETMDWNKWITMEKLLEKYEVTPIVGIIPDNKDPEFCFDQKENFWNKCSEWKKKGWTIAQHGYQHRYHQNNKNKYFQLAHEKTTEFAGVSISEQYKMLLCGYNIMVEHEVIPTCFFAPAHTFDSNTIAAIKQIGKYNFVSDGYALRPYKKRHVAFLPSIFDTPHEAKKGIFTFVYHPNTMNEKKFMDLENFLKKNQEKFVNADTVMNQYLKRGLKGQGIIGRFIEYAIYIIRGMRNSLRR